MLIRCCERQCKSCFYKLIHPAARKIDSLLVLYYATLAHSKHFACIRDIDAKCIHVDYYELGVTIPAMPHSITVYKQAVAILRSYGSSIHKHANIACTDELRSVYSHTHQSLHRCCCVLAVVLQMHCSA
eukprot:20046-Heterococcus_DN1.PRE.2